MPKSFVDIIIRSVFLRTGCSCSCSPVCCWDVLNVNNFWTTNSVYLLKRESIVSLFVSNVYIFVEFAVLVVFYLRFNNFCSIISWKLSAKYRIVRFDSKLNYSDFCSAFWTPLTINASSNVSVSRLKNPST